MFGRVPYSNVYYIIQDLKKVQLVATYFSPSVSSTDAMAGHQVQEGVRLRLTDSIISEGKDVK